MRDDARLLIVESIIPPGNERFFGKLLDLIMLALPGGKERTEEEYRKLLQGAGFRLTSITPTASEVSVIEGARGEQHPRGRRSFHTSDVQSSAGDDIARGKDDPPMRLTVRAESSPRL